MKNSIKFCMILISLLSIKTIFTEDKPNEDSKNNEWLNISKYLSQEQLNYLKKQHEYYVDKFKEKEKMLSEEMERIEKLIEEMKLINVIKYKLREFKNDCKNFMNAQVEDRDNKIVCLCS
jgi:hypothetical protein